MSTQPNEDLSVAIERAIKVCTEYGLADSAESFLRDFSDEPRITSLLSSENDEQRAYGQVLQELRDHAHKQAMSAQPVPSMVEAGSSTDPVSSGEVADGSFVDDTEAPKVEAPVPAPVAETSPEPEPDYVAAEEMGEQVREALAQKCSDILALLGVAPVTHLRLPPVAAAQISSPAITEEAKQVVLRVVAPIMAACGILEVAITPSYFDPSTGQDNELDISTPDGMLTFVREALRR